MSIKLPDSRFVILFLTFLTPNLENTIQQTTIDDINAIQATCDYIYDSEHIYTCNLLNAVIVNDFDVLEITGAHLDDRTDEDILKVNYHNTSSKYFKGEVFRKFKNLQTLKLLGQKLEEISQDAFEVCPNLMVLYIQFNDLIELPNLMLKNCDKLITLKLAYTGLRKIPENLFGQTKNLEELIISNNQLTSLPEKLLENLENLRLFDASFNFIKILSSDFFVKNPNLKHVDVSYNNFEDQASISVLIEHTIILKMSLKFNNFKNFDFNFFSQFENLEELAIGSTEGPKLTEISWQSLSYSIVSLIVYGVGEDIPENSFDNLQNLRLLSLTGRDIVNIHKDTFRALNKLEIISIEGTSISTLHSELFINQASLSDFNFRDNKIQSLSVGIFKALVNLGNLSEHHGIKISFNNIQRLSSNSFGQHPHLRFIDFSSNKIIEIEKGIFSKFHSNLTCVDFYHNFCVDELYVYPIDLDDDERMASCYGNWIETTKSQSTEGAEETTSGGSGNNFKYFEVLLIIFVGLVLNLMRI